MSSPHEVFCESPHQVFIESRHEVRGCAGPSDPPMFVMYAWIGISEDFSSPTFIRRGPKKTRLYRIDNGRVTWERTFPDMPLNLPGVWGHSYYATAYARLEYNNHGLFLSGQTTVSVDLNTFEATVLYFVTKIDLLTGDTLATFETLITPGPTAAVPPTHLCANLQHIFLLSTRFEWVRLSPDLEFLESGQYQGPLVKMWPAPPPSQPTWSDSSQFVSGGSKAAIITSIGNPRMLGIELNRDDPSGDAVTFFKGFPPGGGRWQWHPSIYRLSGATHLITGKQEPTPIGFRSTWFTSTGIALPGFHCVRNPTPTNAEVLLIGSVGPGTFNLSQSVVSGQNALFGSFNSYSSPVWVMDIHTLLSDYLQQSQAHLPLPAGATMIINLLRHGGDPPTIRVMGWIQDENVSSATSHIFACDIFRGPRSGDQPTVNWYVDSRSTPTGGIPLEVMTAGGEDTVGGGASLAATGIMGSGEDSVMTPSN